MPPFDDLIQIIYQQGCYSEAGRSAVCELLESGEDALDAFLNADPSLKQSSLHPRDIADSVSDVFGEFAKQHPDALIDRREIIGELQLYWALGAARGQRSIDVLINGLKSSEQYCRWAAAESLIRRHSKRAAPAIIAALKDRSSMVKTTVVFAMRSNRIF